MMTSKEVVWVVKATLRNRKPNKTNESEHPPIFNKLILFNLRINFIFKNNLTKNNK
jgi:hypothetical protein